jgi:hypothetical protein
VSTSKTQDCIDSAGRLTAFLNDLFADIEHLDVLALCAEANVGLYRDTDIAKEAITQLTGETV